MHDTAAYYDVMMLMLMMTVCAVVLMQRVCIKEALAATQAHELAVVLLVCLALREVALHVVLVTCGQ